MSQLMTRRDFLKRSGLLGTAAATMGLSDLLSAGQAGAAAMPGVKLGSLEVSRLVLDADPFLGQGHPRFLVCKAMCEYYTPERTMRTLDEAADLGVSAVIGPSGGKGPEGDWPGLFMKYRDQGGKLRNWIIEVDGKPAALESGVKRAAGMGPAAIFLAPARTDPLIRNDDWDTLQRWIGTIRQCNTVVGIATHSLDNVAIYEKRLPADFYVHFVYRVPLGSPEDLEGSFPPEKRRAALEAAGKIRKPVIAHKALDPLAGDPAGQLEQALRDLSAKDAISVGVYTKDDPRQIEKFCAFAAGPAGK